MPENYNCNFFWVIDFLGNNLWNFLLKFNEEILLKYGTQKYTNTYTTYVLLIKLLEEFVVSF